ncbi:hypothetical protein ACFL6S_12465 [Candidatus Poribacteria bacterium]
MSLNHILGIIIITIAYGLLWYLVLYGRRIIGRIDDSRLENLREIKRELGLNKDKNG